MAVDLRTGVGRETATTGAGEVGTSEEARRHKLFDELMQEANILFKKDIPELGISEAEYSLMMLIKLGMVDGNEAKVFLKQFSSFGGGKDGRVTRTEMEEAQRAEAQRIIEIRQDNLERRR